MIITQLRVAEEQPVITRCQDERLRLRRHGLPLSPVDPDTGELRVTVRPDDDVPPLSASSTA